MAHYVRLVARTERTLNGQISPHSRLGSADVVDARGAPGLKCHYSLVQRPRAVSDTRRGIPVTSGAIRPCQEPYSSHFNSARPPPLGGLRLGRAASAAPPPSRHDAKKLPLSSAFFRAGPVLGFTLFLQERRMVVQTVRTPANIGVEKASRAEAVIILRAGAVSGRRSNVPRAPSTARAPWRV